MLVRNSGASGIEVTMFPVGVRARMESTGIDRASRWGKNVESGAISIAAQVLTEDRC
jgi:hypothetical protein